MASLRPWFVCALALAVGACSEEQTSRFVAPDAGFDAGAEAGAACATDPQCDDRIACTVDHCRAGACTHEPCTDCCPDGLMCVEGFGCGPARRPCTMDSECSDGVRCTLDRCRDGRFCESRPQDALCDTGTVCFAALGCIPPPPATCARDADCSRTACGGQWRCQPELGCSFRARTSCDDNDACTADTCDDARGGCQHAPLDEDRDGHPPPRCRGDDCDDSDPRRFPGAAEVCANGVDEDCDGMVDEGCCVETSPCTTSCGSPGLTSCGDGGVARCVPPAESCNGRDDNCDGVTDEGCCTGGGSCMTPCGSTGRTACGDAGAGCIPPGEVCNGRDDDCNGAPDNGFACVQGTVEACTTACGSPSTRACSGSCVWGACAPPAETCNGRDDDCDGAADNTFACALNATGTCVTSCGSTGARRCESGCAWGACVPPAETCNGRDDDCDGTTDEGCCAGGGACTTACGSAGRTSCDDGGVRCVPPAESCNGRDDDCNGVADNGFACVAGATGACTTSCGSAGTRSCLGSCTWDACTPPREVCNGVDDNCNAACDEGFTCCARQTRDCTALGFTRGTAVCRGDCGGFDTSTCDNCGNRVRDGSEQCDGADLAAATCASRGFGGGTLRCRPDCTFDTTGCTSCGNNRIDSGELCDGTDLGGRTCMSLGSGFTGGTLRCNTACALDTSQCTGFNPTGTWTFTPPQTLRCAQIFGTLYSVDYTFGALSITDDGTTMTVSGGGLNCQLTGPSARTSRMVNATCYLPGTCAERYTLTGTFSTDRAFTGTFAAVFTGGGCRDCTSRSGPVSASR